MGNWLTLKTLIVGCSFCTTLGEQKSGQWQLSPDVTVQATSGTGNQAIAARVLYECSRSHYNRVIVIWTGINRLDTVITRALHETYPGALDSRPEYNFCTPLEGSVWYHSGGQAGSWTWDKTCPRDIQQIFKTQYLGADSRYLTDSSLSNIVLTQSFLQSRGIEHDMSFIYNPFADYSETPYDHCFGTINQTSAYFDLINWQEIKLENTAFEWAKSQEFAMESDTLHPTRNAMRTWIDLTFGIDIAV